MGNNLVVYLGFDKSVEEGNLSLEISKFFCLPLHFKPHFYLMYLLTFITQATLKILEGLRTVLSSSLAVPQLP